MLNTGTLLAPALTPILRDRKSCLLISGVAGLHVTLTALGLPSWRCPFRYGLGIPCPGCGLSRAVDALWHGQWHDAFLLHAFAPALLVGLVVIFIAAVLPNPSRAVWVQSIDMIERRTGLVIFLLSGLILYWLIRLLFYTEGFYQLVM